MAAGSATTRLTAVALAICIAALVVGWVSEPARATCPPGTSDPAYCTAGQPLLDPFPVVRVKGRTRPSGSRIDLLEVRAPRSSKIEVRCRGRRCPFTRKGRKARSYARRVRFRRLTGFLPAGTLITVTVSKRGYVGKYTRLRIRRARPPARRDLCLDYGDVAPHRCPPRS